MASHNPFDPSELPDRQIGPPARRDRESNRAMSVTQLCRLIRDVLQAAMPGTVTVSGEVSNFSERRHWYLSLKDADSVVSCVMWSSQVRKVGFVPEVGSQVVAHGHVDFYAPQGRLQLYLDRLEPAGIGALEQLLRDRKEQLRQAGWFDESRKKALPVFPCHIAVITSAKGAALQDVIRTAEQRWAGCRITLVDVRVQGGAAAGEVARAIGYVDRVATSLGIDAMIVTRGGGSLEDLWAFNEMPVVEAIYHARLPVVAAIGHETDLTLAELVADLRCSTPTQAAERLIADARSERQRLGQLARRLDGQIAGRLAHARMRYQHLSQHVWFRQPMQVLDRYRQYLDHQQKQLQHVLMRRVGDERELHHRLFEQLQQIEPQTRLREAEGRLTHFHELLHSRIHLKLDRAARDLIQLAGRLARAMSVGLQRDRDRLSALDRQLRAIGPHQVLDRGYTYTTDADGRVVRRAAQVQVGQVLTTHFVDGRTYGQVLRQPEAGQPIRRKKTSQGQSDQTGGLFEDS